MKEIDLEYIKNILKSNLKKDRYIHTLNVAAKAVELADIYGADKYKCEVAGLLHDVMKNNDSYDNLQIIKRSGIMLDNAELKSKALWHAIAGSIYARDELGVQDEEILNAIRYHTSGRANMSLVEKILFVADSISDDRDYIGVDELRSLAKVSLDKAILKSISDVIVNLLNGNRIISLKTIDAYNSLISD